MKYWLVLVLLFAGCASERWTRWTMIQDGEEFKLGSPLACCDCGLVHNVTYRIEDGRVFVKVWRNEWLTAERRKHLRDVNE